MVSLIAMALKALISLLVSAAVIWAAQIIVLPKEKEKPFTSGRGLAIVGAIVDFLFARWTALLGFGMGGFLIKVVVLVLWLLLLKSWFNVGWGHAILISIVAWVLNLIALVALGLIRLL